MKNCFVSLKQNEQAPVHLFLFPFAGGTAQSYRFLGQSPALSGCNIYSLELPGRGIRMSEPFVMTVDEIREECLRSIEPFLNDKMIFLGHSMGAILAYELLSDIEVRYPHQQTALIISAANSPRSIAVKHDVSKMSAEEFKAYVKNMGGIPSQISENESLLDFFLPRIRNDFELLQQYKPRNDKSLRSPIQVIAATDDSNLETEFVMDWQHYTQTAFQITWCEGGHFYLYDNQALVIEAIQQVMQELANEQG